MSAIQAQSCTRHPVDGNSRATITRHIIATRICTFGRVFRVDFWIAPIAGRLIEFRWDRSTLEGPGAVDEGGEKTRAWELRGEREREESAAEGTVGVYQQVRDSREEGIKLQPRRPHSTLISLIAFIT